MRVYVICEGSYSDQSWGPVFSTVEKALAYKGENTDMDIEVHVIDNENDTGPAYPIWRLIFDREGNLLFSEKNEPEPYEPQLHSKPEVILVPEKARWYTLDNIKPRTLAHTRVDNIHAPSLDYAVKIAGDARRAFLASKG